jgi:hypothetical protein
VGIARRRRRATAELEEISQISHTHTRSNGRFRPSAGGWDLKICSDVTARGTSFSPRLMHRHTFVSETVSAQSASVSDLKQKTS